METGTELVDRGGVLQQPEQYPTIDPGKTAEEQRQLVVMLAAYVKELTRMSSGDAAILALMAAAKQAGVPKHEAIRLLLPLIKQAGRQFPPGFM
jgi:hypothetical protein